VIQHTSTPSIWEAEVRGIRVSCQPGLCSEILSQNKTKTNKKTKPRKQKQQQKAVSENFYLFLLHAKF
jgi:hypothetical protein